MKTFEIADEKQPLKRWKDQENSSTYWKFEKMGFEISNELIMAVNKSAEGTKEKFWDNFKIADADCTY